MHVSTRLELDGYKHVILCRQNSNFYEAVLIYYILGPKYSHPILLPQCPHVSFRTMRRISTCRILMRRVSIRWHSVRYFSICTIPSNGYGQPTAIDSCSAKMAYLQCRISTLLPHDTYILTSLPYSMWYYTHDTPHTAWCSRSYTSHSQLGALSQGP
jgi:hypothetical protein